MLLWVVESAMYSSCRGTVDFIVLIRVRCCSLDALYSSESCVFWVVDISRLLNRVMREERIEVMKEGDGGNSNRL
jgi:hypothetical protein